MAEPPPTLWVRQSSTENKRFYETLFPDEPDAVRYIRADLHHAATDGIQAALEALSDNDVDGAAMILRTALQSP